VEVEAQQQRQRPQAQQRNSAAHGLADTGVNHTPATSLQQQSQFLFRQPTRNSCSEFSDTDTDTESDEHSDQALHARSAAALAQRAPTSRRPRDAPARARAMRHQLLLLAHLASGAADAEAEAEAEASGWAAAAEERGAPGLAAAAEQGAARGRTAKRTRSSSPHLVPPACELRCTACSSSQIIALSHEHGGVARSILSATRNCWPLLSDLSRSVPPCGWAKRRRALRVNARIGAPLVVCATCAVNCDMLHVPRPRE
jgi:hypothetical protein